MSNVKIINGYNIKDEYSRDQIEIINEDLTEIKNNYLDLTQIEEVSAEVTVYAGYLSGYTQVDFPTGYDMTNCKVLYASSEQGVGISGYNISFGRNVAVSFNRDNQANEKIMLIQIIDTTDSIDRTYTVKAGLVKIPETEEE